LLSNKTCAIPAIPPMPQLQQDNMPHQILKEVEFRQEKRKKRKFEAFEFNALCSNEVDPDFEADATAFFKDRKKNTNKRKTNEN